MKYHVYHVYILQCADGTFYVGITSDFEKRMAEHHEGFYTNCYTFSRRPLELKFQETFQFVKDAISREKQIKGWSRKKKEALIAGDIELLRQLSRNRTKDN